MSKKKKRAQESKQTESKSWTDLEEAFFAAAPPDEPEASEDPMSFDDLLPATGEQAPAGLRRALDEIRRFVGALAGAPRGRASSSSR
jgi:hypothetical protein